MIIEEHGGSIDVKSELEKAQHLLLNYQNQNKTEYSYLRTHVID